MQSMRHAAFAAIFSTLSLLTVVTSPAGAAQTATPSVSCESAAAASPMPSGGGLVVGTPEATTQDSAAQHVDFDQLYIDMMVPHHTSIIALAQVAQDRLTDERLQSIAAQIVTDQTREIEELRGYRDQFYGDPQPMPLDEEMMATVMQAMPGMHDTAAMHLLMEPQALVAAFCAGDDPNLAFIDLTIPHHEMAIQASEAALDQAAHEEIRTLAQRVIDAQRQEVDELQTIRAELSGEATPTS
jgi:uncharacterized protein (DUF305 family)